MNRVEEIGLALLLLLHLAVIVRAITLDGREPYARAAWVMMLALLPIVGTIIYLLFGEPWMSGSLRRKARTVYYALDGLLPAPASVDVLQKVPDRFRNAFRTCEHIARWSTDTGNAARVAPDSDTAIAMLVEDIDRAERTVHLSFYIWLTDHNGRKVVEAVCRAARRGVTCRIVADAIGSRDLIRSPCWREMEQAGARLCASLKAPLGLAFLVGHRLDLRNHRKVVVIDGRIAYGGSQNCADPAFLVKRRFAPWVDILIRYEGPIVRQNQLIFASAWTVETGEDLAAAIGSDPVASLPDGFEAIAVGTGPLSSKGAMTDMFAAVLAGAERRVVITTPYFVPDPTLLSAIVSCARRGVVTTMVFPRRNDNRVVGTICRSYYPALSRAGVRIFEYCGGLLHAKTLVADSAVALVGSSNMDRRSLDLNFENNILFHSPDLTAQVEAHQQRWLAQSAEIPADEINRRSLPRRFVQNLATMFGPLF